MQKQKLELHFRSQQRKYQELTPKICAKTPTNYRQRKLAGQSSALPANRTKQKEVNNMKIQHQTHRYQSIKRDKSGLTEQQIKDSAIYRLLEQQIASLTRRQQSQILKMQQLKISNQKQMNLIKTEQHSIKLQIWQLRNETMQLKDSIKEEKQQTEKLMEQLGVTEQDFQNINTSRQVQEQNAHQDNLQDQQQYEIY